MELISSSVEFASSLSWQLVHSCDYNFFKYQFYIFPPGETVVWRYHHDMATRLCLTKELASSTQFNKGNIDDSAAASCPLRSFLLVLFLVSLSHPIAVILTWCLSFQLTCSLRELRVLKVLNLYEIFFEVGVISTSMYWWGN